METVEITRKLFDQLVRLGAALDELDRYFFRMHPNREILVAEMQGHMNRLRLLVEGWEWLGEAGIDPFSDRNEGDANEGEGSDV